VVLLIADISGYTQFMLSHRKALAHSQMIVAGLMETLMAQAEPPLRIVELEGDAVFLYADRTDDEASWSEKSAYLVDRIQRFFEVFDHRLAELAAYSICRCDACANLQQLELKVVAHAGEALLNQVGDFSVLSGVDVIAVHRMLKNSREDERYVLLSESAKEALGTPADVPIEESIESYDIGEIRTFAYVPSRTESRVLDEIRGSFSEENVAVQILRHEIKTEYTQVACDPNVGFHFNTGRSAAEACEYDMAIVDRLPAETVSSFAGTGNPFSLGAVLPGEHVVDLGAGAGMDALIAGGMVGPDGHVIGVEMTSAMLEVARRSAVTAALPHVEFREGHIEALPIPDEWADLIVANGVLNLSPDKPLVLSECLRVLKPGGRLQFGDVTVETALPPEAKRQIDLWTH